MKYHLPLSVSLGDNNEMLFERKHVGETLNEESMSFNSLPITFAEETADVEIGVNKSELVLSSKYTGVVEVERKFK